MPETTPQNQPTSQTPTPEAAPTPAPTPAPQQTPAPSEPPLGEAGLRALQAERDARAEAERQRAETQRELDELKRANETEVQRKEREAEEGRQLAEQGRAALREAKTITALASAGIVGPAAAAAVRLLDGVQYDDAHQPINLTDRLAAAKAAYGEQVFAGATPAPTSTTTPTPTPTPTVPTNLHQGPRATPTQEEEDAQFEAAFASAFPHHAQAQPAT